MKTLLRPFQRRRARPTPSGRELITAGLECQRTGSVQEGILFLARGLAAIGSKGLKKQPRDALVAFHALAFSFSELGLPIVVRGIINHARPLYQQVEDPQLLAQLPWLEGRCALQQGDHSGGLAYLDQAIQALTLHGLAADVRRVRDERRRAERLHESRPSVV